jgi:glycosyltransferase involved in cell wall biosynthesis
MLSSAAHHRNLPQSFSRQGLVRAVVRSYPALEILEPDPAGNLRLVHRFPLHRLGNRVLWAVWNRLPAQWRGLVPLLAWGQVADQLISTRLPRAGIFHGMMGACLASLRRVQTLGAVTLVDNATLHPAAFERETMADCASVGAPAEHREGRMRPSLQRICERQYEMCDRIIVYSAAAKRSFEPFPYRGKTVVIHPGVDHRLYCPPPVPRTGGTFRVCYVGRIEAPKGLHHLVGAWKRLALPDAELVLAGRVSVMSEMAGLLTDAPRAGIRVAGILSPEGVRKCLQESELFVFPSVNEGLSLALLEAMACGLPVMACRDTGAEDCVAHGKEGLLVPGRNTEALAEAIRWCHGHRDEVAAMGRAARVRIESEFTFSHYEERLQELYRSAACDRL